LRKIVLTRRDWHGCGLEVDTEYFAMHTISRRALLAAAAMAAGGFRMTRAQDAPVPATSAGYFEGLDTLGGLASVTNRYYENPAVRPLLFAEEPAGVAAWLGALDLTLASFDSEDNAIAAIETFAAIAATHLAMPLETLREISPDGLEGFSDSTVIRELHFTEINSPVTIGPRWTAVVLAPFGASLVFARAIGYGEMPLDEPRATIMDIVRQVGETAPGDADPMFNADGTSTGGDWDRFPPAGDPVLGESGIAPLADTALYPEWLY
jgi:hypothetical protein